MEPIHHLVRSPVPHQLAAFIGLDIDHGQGHGPDRLGVRQKGLLGVLGRNGEDRHGGLGLERQGPLKLTHKLGSNLGDHLFALHNDLQMSHMVAWLWRRAQRQEPSATQIDTEVVVACGPLCIDPELLFQNLLGQVLEARALVDRAVGVVVQLIKAREVVVHPEAGAVCVRLAALDVAIEVGHNRVDVAREGGRLELGKIYSLRELLLLLVGDLWCLSRSWWWWKNCCNGIRAPLADGHRWSVGCLFLG